MVGLRGSSWLAFVIAATGCTNAAGGAHIAPEVAAAMRDESRADVIVNLRQPRDRERIARLQRAVASSLGSEFRPHRLFQGVSALSGSVTELQLERLRDDPDVHSVQLAGRVRGQLMEAVPATFVDRVRERFELTGRGVRVAVLDSGVDASHPDLEGAVVAQHCFTRGNCAPWNANEGTDASDAHGHGTGVAGTIASRGVLGPMGFAPDAEIVAIKVHDLWNRGSEDDVAAALDWIAAHQSELNVDIVTLAMATDTLYADAKECDASQPALARAIANLVERGVIVVGASGNLGSTESSAAPGCIRGVVSVGATYDDDVGAQPAGGGTFSFWIGAGFDSCRDETTQRGRVACYTNAAPRVDVLAPGGPMLTTRLGGGTATHWGTSQAAAAVSGIAALLRECNPTLSAGAFKRALVQSGEPQLDERSGRTFPRVRAVHAALAACPQLAPPKPAATDGGMNEPAEPGAGSAGAAPEPSPERSAGALLDRFTDPSRADPLGPRRPVGPPRSTSRRTDAGVRDVSVDPDSGSERARGESVSSCSLLGGPTPRTGAGLTSGPTPRTGAGLTSYLLIAWLWILVAARRRS